MSNAAQSGSPSPNPRDRGDDGVQPGRSVTVGGHPARLGVRFESLFRGHYRAVEAFVVAQFPGVDVAEVMSQVFATAWRRLDDVPVEAERGWLIGVANNTALNALRGRRRRSARDEAYRTMRPRGSTALHDHNIPPETLDQLTVGFAALSTNDREIIQLAAFDGLTGADLGAALDTSPGTAAVRLHRARQRLSEHYRQQETL